ncbi:MAG: hypothetical protein QOK12_3208, partial [Mycobacterium sp.]|nr:hypothetical protein [Mycobacterium sp.]
HRIGRTGRAGKTGIAVTLVDWDELPRWTTIDKALGLGSPDPAETYSNSPTLYDELDIPTDVTGTVGAAARSSNGSKDRPKREARDGERPARNRDRTRQRTRGASSGTGHVENSEQTPAASNDEASPADGTGPARRRRRRRRPSTAAPSAG